jgi:uncharacterized membrane-anchored protein
MFSQTLGTALGDWTADTAGRGYLGGAAIFSGLLALVLLAYFFTGVSRTALGAVVGDYLDKPIAKGGLELSRYTASAALIVLIVMCVFTLPKRAARSAH